VTTNVFNYTLAKLGCNCYISLDAVAAMPPLPRPRRIVGVSLKMYFDLQTTLSYVRGVHQLDGQAWNARVDVFVIPDFVTLMEAGRILESSSIMLGAQDTFWEDKGAYTGEVSPAMIRQAGARIVEIGHAERRALFGETDETVAKKAAAAARNGLIPLVCIGERTHHSIASAAVGAAIAECRPQVTSVLAAVPDHVDVILAYEPVWAIGAAQPADADHVVNVTKELRKLASGRKGVTRIVYGGSAGPGTFATIAEGVDGLFLGRFAHDINNLKKVIEEVGGA
jgi:triosephosphate isomerase